MKVESNPPLRRGLAPCALRFAPCAKGRGRSPNKRPRRCGFAVMAPDLCPLARHDPGAYTGPVNRRRPGRLRPGEGGSQRPRGPARVAQAHPLKPMPFGNSTGFLSRRDTTTIAQRFNAGTGQFCVPPVPKGRLNPSTAGRVPFRPAFGRPFGTWGVLTARPSVETLGYSRMSLRDKDRRSGRANFRKALPLNRPCKRKIPENPGKSRKKIKKQSAPATAPNREDHAAVLANYDQLSAIMSKYNLSALPPPPVRSGPPRPGRPFRSLRFLLFRPDAEEPRADGCASGAGSDAPKFTEMRPKCA